METTITNVVIGTHNSMTFSRPAKWYGYLMIPFARCQRKDTMQQFYAGARCFDLRVRFLSDGTPCFAHGLMRLKGNVQRELMVINNLAVIERAKVYVRLVLEDPKLRVWQEKLFRDLCRLCETKYTALTFFQGTRKGDWAQVYEFKAKPVLAQCVGSMAADARWYERFIPWLYARRRNAANLANPPAADITIYDFI